MKKLVLLFLIGTAMIAWAPVMTSDNLMSKSTLFAQDDSDDSGDYDYGDSYDYPEEDDSDSDDSDDSSGNEE